MCTIRNHWHAHTVHIVHTGASLSPSPLWGNKPEAVMQDDIFFKHQLSLQLLNANSVLLASVQGSCRSTCSELGIIIQLEWTVQVLTGACSALHTLLIMLIRFHSLPYLIIVRREEKKEKKKCNRKILTLHRNHFRCVRYALHLLSNYSFKLSTIIT